MPVTADERQKNNTIGACLSVMLKAKGGQSGLGIKNPSDSTAYTCCSGRK